MKKIIKKALCLIVTVVVLLSSVACKIGYESDGNGGKIDTTKTQLYVGLVPSGYGNSWLYSAISRFEDAYKDYEFQDGKTGVQVVVDDVSYGNTIAQSLPNARYQIVYTSDVNLYDLVSNNLVYDMTAMVNEEFDDEDVDGNAIKTSIADKFVSADQRNVYSYDDKIYALPWVSSDSAISYDRDLFDEKGLFFIATDPDNNDYRAYYDEEEGEKVYVLGKPSEYKLSMGRDGIYGTYDDGLPATYEQFYFLMSKLCSIGCTPITWSGKYSSYLTQMLYQIWATNEGAENMKLNYTLSGTANDLIASFDANGNPVLASATTINDDNGYLLHNQIGKFYALDFLDNIIEILKTEDVKGYNMAIKEDIDHLNAQNNFLKSVTRSQNDSSQFKRIAMFYDGAYWENEATSTFNQMGEGYGKLDRKIGWMPFPHPTTEGAGDTTYVAASSTVMFVNGNIGDEYVDVASKFVQFMHTRESLAEFTVMTSMIQPFSFDVKDSERAKMSYYGQTHFEKFKTAVAGNDVLDPMSNNPVFTTNYSLFSIISSNNWRTKGHGLNGTDIPGVALRNTDAVTYFKAMQDYYTQSYWNTSVLKR